MEQLSLLLFSFRVDFDFSSIFITRNNEKSSKINYFYFLKLKKEKKYLDNLIQNIGHGYISFSLTENKILKKNKFIGRLFGELKDEIQVFQKLNSNNFRINKISGEDESKYLARSLQIYSNFKPKCSISNSRSRKNDSKLLVNSNAKFNENSKYLKSEKSINADFDAYANTSNKNILTNNLLNVEEKDSNNSEETLSNSTLLEILLLNLTEININFPDTLRQKILSFIKQKKTKFFDVNNKEDLFLSYSTLFYINKFLRLYPEIICDNEFVFLGKIILNSSLDDMINQAVAPNKKNPKQKFLHKKEYEIYLRLIIENEVLSAINPKSESLVEIILNDISVIIKRENKKIIDQCKNIYLFKSAHELKNPITACKECLLEIKDNLDFINQSKYFQDQLLNASNTLNDTGDNFINSCNQNRSRSNSNSTSNNIDGILNKQDSKYFEEKFKNVNHYSINKPRKESKKDTNYKIMENKQTGKKEPNMGKINLIIEYISLQLDIMNQFLDGIEIFSANFNKREEKYSKQNTSNDVKNIRY